MEHKDYHDIPVISPIGPKPPEITEARDIFPHRENKGKYFTSVERNKQDSMFRACKKSMCIYIYIYLLSFMLVMLKLHPVSSFATSEKEQLLLLVDSLHTTV